MFSIFAIAHRLTSTQIVSPDTVLLSEDYQTLGILPYYSNITIC